MSAGQKELLIIRALKASDLGLFSAQRSRVRSKQRAFNINADVARRMLSTELFEAGGATFPCTLVHQGAIIREPRRLAKTHKNWRLGGNQIKAAQFASLRDGDFVLIRTSEGNDGSQPLAMSLVSKAADAVAHGGLAAVVADSLQDGMLVLENGSENFDEVVALCPRELIVLRSLAESDLTVFDELRAHFPGRQRAFQINAKIAKRMISPALFNGGSADLHCVCRFGSRQTEGIRTLKKTQKNWRLGGPRLVGRHFGDLGCKDFLLIRSVEWNDGSHHLLLTLIGKKTQRITHAGIVAQLPPLVHSMLALVSGEPLFDEIGKYCGDPAKVKAGRKPAAVPDPEDHG